MFSRRSVGSRLAVSNRPFLRTELPERLQEVVTALCSRDARPRIEHEERNPADAEPPRAQLVLAHSVGERVARQYVVYAVAIEPGCHRDAFQGVVAAKVLAVDLICSHERIQE